VWGWGWVGGGARECVRVFVRVRER